VGGLSRQVTREAAIGYASKAIEQAVRLGEIQRLSGTAYERETLREL
jgi:hypothetical protein